MYYKISINLEDFLIEDHNTATSFASLAKKSIIPDGNTPDKVTIEVLTDEEAAEYETRN